MTSGILATAVCAGLAARSQQEFRVLHYLVAFIHRRPPPPCSLLASTNPDDITTLVYLLKGRVDARSSFESAAGFPTISRRRFQVIRSHQRVTNISYHKFIGCLLSTMPTTSPHLCSACVETVTRATQTINITIICKAMGSQYLQGGPSFERNTCFAAVTRAHILPQYSFWFSAH